MRTTPTLRATLALFLCATAACTDVTDVHLLEVSATGAVLGSAFIDSNGNGAIDAADSALGGVSVILGLPNVGTVVKSATTSPGGAFAISDVPVGSYTLRLDSAVLADSLTMLGPITSIAVARQDTVSYTLGATFPTFTLAGVRAAAPGNKVFTTGVALNARQNFSDGEVSFRAIVAGDTAYLRATNVQRAPLQAGDSVRVLGRTASDNGQPTLNDVTLFILISQATVLVPVEVSTGAASTAGGGALDAALVRIRTAEIADTSTVNGDFHFWAHNDGDSVEVVFRSFLGMSTSAIRPDTVTRISQATGLLSPFFDGASTRWRLLPRGGSDVILENKIADLEVHTAFDAAQANVGDTVQIQVTLSNNGPDTATGASAVDTIPAALMFVSYSSTAGTYDESTGVWSLGDLPANAAADTLTISAEVTGGPGTVTNTARVGKLLKEVEPAGDNNDSANASLTVS